MAYITLPGIKGQLYIPEDVPGSTRKHDCRDCASCLMCNDDKCAMCRGQKACARGGKGHLKGRLKKKVDPSP